MTFPIKQWLLLALWMLAVCLPLSGQAQPYIANERGDQIWDKATNLVWQRCSVGQTWNGTTCTGKTQEFTFAQAQNQGGNGWRVPTVRELARLVYCSSGRTSNRSDPEDGGSPIATACMGNFSTPTIDTTAFPSTRADPYWSSSSNLKSSDHAGIVNFSLGYVYGWGTRSSEFNVRLVRTSQVVGDEAAFAFWLGRQVPKQDEFSPEVWAQGSAMEQSLGAVPLPWEPKSASNPRAQRSNAPPMDLQKLATTLKALAMADIHRPPVIGVVSPPNLTAPVREAFQPRTASLPAKGEFETTAAYEARKQQAEQTAKDNAEQAYQAALRAFNTAQLSFNKQQAKQEADNAAARAQDEARKTDPQAYRSALLKAWAAVMTFQLGDPVLQKVAYDADRQVFTAKLFSSSGFLMGDVTAPVPLARASGFKDDLLSGKIAPKVMFAYPSMRLEWALIENSAQRSARFAAAQNSIDQLEALMREFPNAPEVAAARRRVQALIAQEFAKANTSSQLQAVLNKYPNAHAAPTARQRVEQLRLAEQRAEREAQEAQRRAEREAQEAARRQREWENSPQGQAQRQQQQQRQLCEAQKATCVASCPRFVTSWGERTNIPESSCERSCNRVSCN